MTTCPHLARKMDGTYAHKGVPFAAAWTCRACGTSGATLRHLVSPEEWEEAEAIYRTGKRANEMTAGRK